MGYFRDIKYEAESVFDELVLLAKHPTRKTTRHDLSYHWYKLCNALYGHPWYCLKRGITNIVKWFPVIWRNDVFDHCYLLDIIDKQLDEMEKFWYSDNPHVMKQEQVAKRITWTRKLLKMHRDEHYTVNWYYEHKAKFPSTMFEGSEPHTTDEFGIVTSYICRPMGEEERNHYRSGIDKAIIMDEKVYRLFIKNLSKLREWWD